MKNKIEKKKLYSSVGIIAAIALGIFSWATFSKHPNHRAYTLVAKDNFRGYPRVVEMAMRRLNQTSGIPIEKMLFDRPEKLSIPQDRKLGVFSPSGGQATYQVIPTNVTENSEETPWVFLTQFDHQKINVMAFANNIKKDVCLLINKKDEILGIPRLNSDQSELYEVQKRPSIAEGTIVYLDSPELAGRKSGCFETFSGRKFWSKKYIFYYTLFDEERKLTTKLPNMHVNKMKVD